MYCKEDLNPPDENEQELTLAPGDSIDLKCPRCKAVWKFWASTQLFHKLIKGGKFNEKPLGRVTIKDFDGWNEIKKSLHAKPNNLGVHEREIWWTSFGVNVGVEIDGKHDAFERPSLILRKFNRQMTWALPITSIGKDRRFYEKFLLNGKEYFVVLTQLRTISTKRFIRKIGMASKSDFERIVEKATRFLK